MIDKGLLQRVKRAALGQSLDGDDVFPADVSNRILAGPYRFLVDDHRARAAQILAAAEFGPRESEVGAQHPQEFPVSFDLQFCGLSVESEIYGFFHGRTLPWQI
jgi:hypothetical protein